MEVDAEAALELLRKEGKLSTSSLQRHMFWGYARAARAMDYLELQKLITAASGVKPRRLVADIA